MSLLVAHLLLLLGLPSVSTAPVNAPAAPLSVYAAASLTEAFTELGRMLERDHAGLIVRFNFAGSQQLAAQIEQGAPADIFASADQRWMHYLTEKGRVDGEPAVFARNRLVLIVPRSNPARIGKLQDLARSGTKLVVAADAVPAGKYSRDMLAKLAAAPGFPADYDRRVIANIVSQEETVKNVVAKVQLGEADAGLVYRSDVTPAVAGSVRVFDIPEQYNVIASYPIALLKGAPNADAGRWFLELVASEQGQRVLRRHGLMPAGADVPAGAPR